jgi:hypothetical protein
MYPKKKIVALWYKRYHPAMISVSRETDEISQQQTILFGRFSIQDSKLRLRNLELQGLKI